MCKEIHVFGSVVKVRLLKVTLLSGRSTVVLAWDHWDVALVLARCRSRLCLAEDGTTMELWHCSGEKVPVYDTA
eukprot:6462286-Amphidinium_carterae.1